MASHDPGAELRAGLHRNWAELAAGLAFLTRLPSPLPPAPAVPPAGVLAAVWSFPLIGALIGLAAGAVLAVAAALGLPPLAAAGLALAAAAAITGALHEDGLADTLDGFGGGRDRAGKLAIMRDSRLGTYGALGLMLALLVRAGLLSALAIRGGAAAVLVLAAAECVSRAAMVAAWHRLPAARADGLSQGAGRPDDRAAFTAFLLAGLVALAATVPFAGLWATLVALAGTAAATAAFIRLCRAQIGGQTGDTLGAAQQLAVTAYLLLVLAFA